MSRTSRGTHQCGRRGVVQLQKGAGPSREARTQTKRPRCGEIAPGPVWSVPQMSVAFAGPRTAIVLPERMIRATQTPISC